MTTDPHRGEAAVIAASAGPRTRQSLTGDLRALGVRPGETLLVHSSLAAVGWTVGGAPAFVQAVLSALGPGGTLVVPTQTGGNSDPRGWRAPAVPEQWWPVIRAHLPGYDPVCTPSRGMGAVPESVRCWPGAVRSGHPQVSFAGVGPLAAELLAVHDLASPFGERSPLAALERAGARVLLVGVDFGSCTALHLAESRLPGAGWEEHGCAVLCPDGSREWVTYRAPVANAGDFAGIGLEFTESGAVTHGLVGSAASRLFGLAEVVAFGAGRLAR
jgi:aminoglycoside 3-N-acetyltransferase